MAQLVPDCATQMKYFVLIDSSFCVLSNQSTVIGVSNADRKMIIKHSITDFSEPTVTYTADMDEVFTLGVNELQNVLFAGGSGCDSGGQLLQFDLSTGRAIKTFGQVGIDIIFSRIRVDNLWLFGDLNSSKFAVVDSVSRQVLGRRLCLRSGVYCR